MRSNRQCRHGRYQEPVSLHGIFVQSTGPLGVVAVGGDIEEGEGQLRVIRKELVACAAGLLPKFGDWFHLTRLDRLDAELSEPVRAGIQGLADANFARIEAAKSIRNGIIPEELDAWLSGQHKHVSSKMKQLRQELERLRLENAFLRERLTGRDGRPADDQLAELLFHSTQVIADAMRLREIISQTIASAQADRRSRQSIATALPWTRLDQVEAMGRRVESAVLDEPHAPATVH